MGLFSHCDLIWGPIGNLTLSIFLYFKEIEIGTILEMKIKLSRLIILFLIIQK